MGRLRDQLVSVKRVFEDVGVEWALFAGAVAHLYGCGRSPTDLDILVPPRDLERVGAALGREVEVTKGSKGRVCWVRVMDMDIIEELEMRVAGETYRFYMDDEMLERRRWMTLMDILVPVIPVEDNIIFKAIQQRGAEEGKYDIEDIKGMIRDREIDIEYLKRRIGRMGAEKRTIPLLKKLGLPLEA